MMFRLSPGRLVRIVLAVAAVSGMISSASAEDGPDKASIGSIQQQCDERLKALGTSIDKTAGVLDKFDDLLTALEKETKEKPETAKKAAGAAGTEPKKVIRQAKAARESTALYVDLAKGMRQRAKKALALAKREPNPEVQLVYYRQALDFIRHGETMTRRAVPVTGNPKTRIGPLTIKKSIAFAQLKAMAGALKAFDPSSHADILYRSLDGAAAHAGEAVLGGVGTNTLSGQPRGYQSGKVTLPNGQTIDTSALESAAAATGAATPRKPLFRSVPSPTGSQQFVLDAEVFNRAQAAADAPGVGGVALKVKIMAMDAAGIAGLRIGSYLEQIDQVVVLSMAQLLRKVEPFAADQAKWRTLPGALRYPGRIGRILGYVLDPARRDVVLFAVKAKRAETRMDIDSLILGLHAAWKEDKEVFVSLDPVPFEPFGPQISRVGGVPKDSIAAKIMLEADYMMKQTLLGKRDIGSNDFASLVQLLENNPDRLTRPLRSRFWFYPVPLRPETLSISRSLRTISFNAGLQVLTEKLEVQQGGFVGSGGAGEIEDHVAADFTRLLDQFSGSKVTDPMGYYGQLRGVASVITMGVLLRNADIDYDVLKRFSSLPYQRLEGRNAVPGQYPGVVADLRATIGGRAIVTQIGGGVSLLSKPKRDGRETGVELIAAHLEPLVDQGRLLEQDSITVALPVLLARPRRDLAERALDVLFLKASTAFNKGRYEAAAELFQAATERDSSSAFAYANLALIQYRLGRLDQAKSAIRRARLLSPQDALGQVIEFAISPMQRTWDEPIRPSDLEFELQRFYTRISSTFLSEDNNAEAYFWASKAIEIDQGLPPFEAYLVRGISGLDRDPAQACEDLRTAWDETEYVAISGGSYDNDAWIYVFASFGLSRCDLQTFFDTLNGSDDPRRIAASALEDLQRAIDYLKSAQAVYPNLSPSFAFMLGVEGVRYKALKPLYTPESLIQETRRLSALGQDVLGRFPDEPGVHAAVGDLYLGLGQTDAAKAVCLSVLKDDPSHVGCLIIRARALSGEGNCGQARRDIQVAIGDAINEKLPGEFREHCGAM